MLSRVPRKAVLVAMIVGALSSPRAYFTPITFSTTGVWSFSGTNVVNFSNGNGTTTLTFNGTTDPINTPAGASFGDIVVTTTVPANLDGPAITGSFTLNFIQVSPAGAGSVSGALSGNIGFNKGIATINFSTTSAIVGGTVYTVSPTSYTLAVPVTGVGGGAGTGTTTIEGIATDNSVENSASPDRRRVDRTKGMN